MANITSYTVLFYGSPDGYQTNRAQISLMDGIKSVGFVRFNDPEMVFENDSNTDGIILMHLPSSLFESVLDILRNEKPVGIVFRQNRGFLYTGLEPVGEGE
jgi:hypothetical protein